MAGKASDKIQYYQNPSGPTIGTVGRKVIEKDGFYFKDLDGSGEWKEYDDWRLPAKERAEAYVKELTVKEKIAQLYISDWRMGKYPSGGPMTLSRVRRCWMKVVCWMRESFGERLFSVSSICRERRLC